MPRFRLGSLFPVQSVRCAWRKMTGTSWHTHWWILELIPVFFLRLAPSSWALPFPNQHVYIFTGTSEAPQIAFRKHQGDRLERRRSPSFWSCTLVFVRAWSIQVWAFSAVMGSSPVLKW